MNNSNESATTLQCIFKCPDCQFYGLGSIIDHNRPKGTIFNCLDVLLKHLD